MKNDIYDGHFDDVHRILRNRLGLTNPAALEIAIADLSKARLVELGASPVKGKFDIPHIRAIHRYIFQDVFPWAGDFRNVTTARTNSFSFPLPIYIESSLETIFLNIHSTAKTTSRTSRLTTSPSVPATISAKSTQSTPSAKAMAAPSASSSARSLYTLGIGFRGSVLNLKRTTRPRASATPPATAPL